MDKVSYSSLQKKYPGKVVAISEKKGQVVASAKTTQELEKIIEKKGVNPATLFFLGPIEKYKQISAYRCLQNREFYQNEQKF